MHIAYLTTLLEELASRGLDSRSLIDPIPAEVSPEHLAELLQRAVALTNDPALGLDFGLRLNLASHGMLGYALMSAKNGQQLIDGLVRFSRLAMPSIELVQKVAGSQFQLVCHADSAQKDEHLLIEIVLASLIDTNRWVFPFALMPLTTRWSATGPFWPWNCPAPIPPCRRLARDSVMHYWKE